MSNPGQLTFGREIFSFVEFFNRNPTIFPIQAVSRFLPGRFLHLFVAGTLAVVYFLFQIEPFEDEYREHHPAPAGTLAFSKPSVNWESFDKTNAPEAFVVDPRITCGPLGIVTCIEPLARPLCAPVHPVRDKSPPPQAL